VSPRLRAEASSRARARIIGRFRGHVYQRHARTPHGFAAGEIPKLPLNLTLLKGCAVLGVYFGDWVRREPQAYRDSIVELARLAAEGKLSCHVDRAYPLAEFPEALKSLSERRGHGEGDRPAVICSRRGDKGPCGQAKTADKKNHKRRKSRCGLRGLLFACS
jgi:hypothetical protein